MNPPAITEFTDLKFPEHEVLTLPNGVKLNVLNHGTQPVVQMMVLWEGGTAECHNVALPMLAMRSMRHGSSLYTADQIEYLLDFNGALLAESVHDHHTGFVLHSLSEKMVDLLPLLVDIISTPLVPDDRLALAKEELLANRRMIEQRVETLASEGAMPLIAGSTHPLSRVADVRAIQSVTRESILKWLACELRPSSMTVYLSGNIGDEMLQQVKKAFGRLGEPMTVSNPLVALPFDPQKAGIRKIEVSDSLQSNIQYMIPAIPRSHPDYCDLRIALYALGGYFGSRLMSNIREDKGLTYGITASLCGYIEGGVATISTSTDNAYVEEVLREINSEVARLASEPLGDEEFSRVCQNYTSGLAAILDSPFSVMGLIATSQLSGAPVDYFDQQFKAITTITPERISDVAAKYLNPEKARIVIAGHSL